MGSGHPPKIPINSGLGIIPWHIRLCVAVLHVEMLGPGSCFGSFEYFGSGTFIPVQAIPQFLRWMQYVSFLQFLGPLDHRFSLCFGVVGFRFWASFWGEGT